MLRGLRLLLRPLFLALATIYFVVDEIFIAFVHPMVERLARLKLVARLEAQIARLPAYATLALFIIPMAILWPIKLAALFFIGEGHVVLGGCMFALAKIVGLGLAERLFAISRGKLLSIHWFAVAYHWVVALRDKVLGYVHATAAWQAAKRAMAQLKSWLRLQVALLRGLVAAGGRGLLQRHFLGARRFVGRRWFGRREA